MGRDLAEKLKRLAPLAIPGFVVAIAVVAILDVRAIYEPTWLLPILNLLFLFIPGCVIAYVSVQGYLVGGSFPLLLFGCAAVMYGTCSGIGGWMIGALGAVNAGIVFYNIGSATGAILIVWSGLHTTGMSAASRSISRRATALLLYAGLGGIMLSLSAASLRGLTPAFVLPGGGFTAVRGVVLGVAVTGFVAATLLFWKRYFENRSDFHYWGTLALAMLSIGRSGLFLQQHVGTLVGWCARSAQYVGSVYFLIAVVRAWRAAQRTNVPVARAIASLFREAEANYRVLVEMATDAIVAFDSAGRVLIWNTAAERLFGYAREETIGASFGEVTGLPAEIEHWTSGKVPSANSEGVLPLASAIQTQATRRDGTTFPVEYSVSVRPIAEGLIGTLILRDITERNRAEDRERLARQTLELLNRSGAAEDTIRDITLEIRKTTGIDAVGIRLREGDDFPYYVANGFAEEFLLTERFLCARDQAGAVVRDSQGNPVLECMCGTILCGRTDPTLPFFTASGSFWTNGATALLASTTEQDRQARTRNRCKSEGYESMALIPLRSDSEIIGLLQLNDRRPNRFTAESIRFFEGMGASIGVALFRKRAEEAVRHAHEHLRCLLDANLIGVVIATPAGGIIEANEYFLRMIGCSREELEQDQIDWRTLTPLEWLAADEYAIGELRERGTCTPYEKEYVRRDGSRVSVFLSDALLPGPDEHIAAFVLDITERKHLEAQLRQQQKLEALGTLAGGVAHEINNPISGIMNYAQLIADTAAPESRAVEYAGEIVAETERVATIVRNLLQFARQEKETHSLARPADIVEQTLSLVRVVLRHDQITLTVDVPENLPPLKCRRQQLQQVLMNLLTNARDALNAKYPGYHAAKMLHITARELSNICDLQLPICDLKSQGTGSPIATRKSEIENGPEAAIPQSQITNPKSQMATRWLRLTVADQGTGIPPEIQTRIFDPFFSTKPRDKGSGLGLSISHGIVKDHGGVLRFETTPGIGTQFHVDLPVEEG